MGRLDHDVCRADDAQRADGRAGGGGLTPWALITGYGTRDSYGANAHYTYLSTQDYTLKSYGVAVGILDRLELSLAKQEFYGSLAPLAVDPLGAH